MVCYRFNGNGVAVVVAYVLCISLASIGVEGFTSTAGNHVFVGRTHAPLFLLDGNPPPFGSYSSIPTSPPPVTAATYPSFSPTTSSSSTATSNTYGSDPIAILARAQEESAQLVRSAIPDLTEKTSLSWTRDMNRILPGSNEATTIGSWDAPGTSNIAWMANVHVPTRMSSLTIFTGPLTSVPHVTSRCSFDVGSNMLELAVDVRPRAYGAYELYDTVAQQYPGPEILGRKAFEYSAARTEYTTMFATPPLQALLDPNQFEGATMVPESSSALERLVSSPLVLWITMPATSANVQAIVKLRQSVVTTYVSWATSGLHQHRPGAPVNTQYVYDSKFRQNAYLALVPTYQRLFGPADGLTLAAAESGPLDEGYVGGGS